MSEHPNFIRTQRSWDSVAVGDFAAAIEQLAEDVVFENGPGAGPWRRLDGREALIAMMMEFIPVFGDTWAQQGTCIYGDDDRSIAFVHETGMTPAGDSFDNRAIYVYRHRPDGVVDRVWTVDLDTEAMEAFWERNPIQQHGDSNALAVSQAGE